MDKRLVALFLVGVIAVAAYIAVSPIDALVFELAYTTFPVIANDKLQDVKFTFQLNRYYMSMPTYQLFSGYSITEGSNKLAIFGIELNFTLNVEIYKDVENGTLWRSLHFVFSSINERKFQIYVGQPQDVTLGSMAVIVVDALFQVWKAGEAPYIDKAIRKVFVVDIPALE